jgi:hypothetical protein
VTQPIPESDETLSAQQDQLLDGSRDAQLFPGGHGELDRPEGISRAKMPNGDVFHYAPDRMTPQRLLVASQSGRENDVLGLGPYTKDEAVQRTKNGEQPVAVVERTPDGTEVRAAAGTHKTMAAQLAAMNMRKSEGHSLSVESPDYTLGKRIEATPFGALGVSS